LAARASLVIVSASSASLRAAVGAQVQPGHLLRQALQLAFGDIATVLFALLVVEELDEVPHLVLLAGRERRNLLDLEDFLNSDRMPVRVRARALTGAGRGRRA
jgi:hypothetical protein